MCEHCTGRGVEAPPATWMAITDVDRLLDGDGGPRDLRRLLDAAAAPGTPRELRGERDAAAAFAAAATSRGRWRLRRATVTASGVVAAKSLAAALAVVGTATGGLALAAGETHPSGPVEHAPTKSPNWSAPGEHAAGVAGAALSAASAATDVGAPVTGQSVAAHGTDGRVEAGHGRTGVPSGPTARSGMEGTGGNSIDGGGGPGGSGGVSNGTGGSVGEAGNSGKIPPGLAKKTQGPEDEQ
ncbi:hypothetical protein GCM10010472_63190 [Pseudonocardia halophobica]|uniref:Uncharacterized protein n=1 Tax=Pseudonocardia halophobica TaxID=29401 RepID=A0A9W6NVT6_9PSEU|nr:hypothetical protein [Pseudonocardia halophobica]GLL10722.1 hypothetical protein GCM10017577_18620 [Pseudonocardia halophobica]